MRTLTVQCSEEQYKELERLSYEFNGKASIVAYLAEDSNIDWESIQDELDEAEKRYVEYDVEKNKFSREICPEEVDLTKWDWSLDFNSGVVTFTEQVKSTPTVVKNSLYVDMDIKDALELQLAQYMYAAGTGVYKFIKEASRATKEFCCEYSRVISARKVEYEKKKNEIARKYKPEEVDLNKWNWEVDFATSIMTFTEA